MSTSATPDLSQEYALQAVGHDRVAGLDEAGRGAWAGPVCAAAVVLPLHDGQLADLLDGVRDSKLLTAKRREGFLATIYEVAVAVGVGFSAPGEIDQWGIVSSTRLAMGRAVDELDDQVDALLVDYVRLPNVDLPQHSLPKADCHCLSVAAASIVAKVERDRLMVARNTEYPGYGFARHKGYGTPEHREALSHLGPSAIHRVSWRPIQSLSDQERA
jgi:ribonuclease HII